MRFRALSTFIIAIAATTFAAGCSNDSSTAPLAPTAPLAAAPTGASQNLLGTLLGAPTTITPLLRTTPLASNVTASVTVGLLGGVINMPSTGLSIIIPPLAAPIGTHITVTALAGSKVAYEFAPHGLHFLLPLVATQDLHHVQNPNGGLLNLLNLRVGYFPDSTHITTITELLGVNVNLLGLSATTTIWHFSGYIFAGGDDSYSPF